MSVVRDGCGPEGVGGVPVLVANRLNTITLVETPVLIFQMSSDQFNLSSISYTTPVSRINLPSQHRRSQ